MRRTAFLDCSGGAKHGGWLAIKSLLHNKSVQLPHGFYTRHLDIMT